MVPDISGRFLFAVDPSAAPGTPFLFLATNMQTPLVEGAEVTMSLQPLAAGMSITEVGAALLPMNNPVPVTMTGEFTANVVGDVPGPANPVSGTMVTFDLRVMGIIRSEDLYCGIVDGNVTDPFTLNLDGSTFAAVRVPDNTALEDVEILMACPAGGGPDAGVPDAMPVVPDAGASDAGPSDAQASDAMANDAMANDATPTDA